jgi:hypothetical protein
VKRIKHNNLLPWFTQDHGTLPASYLASCEEFFKELTQKRIRENMGLEPGEVDDGSSPKRQAPSAKLTGRP